MFGVTLDGSPFFYENKNAISNLGLQQMLKFTHYKFVTMFCFVCQFNFPFVENYTVEEVKIQPKTGKDYGIEDNMNSVDSAETSYPWNIDGDLMEWTTEVLVR